MRRRRCPTAGFTTGTWLVGKLRLVGATSALLKFVLQEVFSRYCYEGDIVPAGAGDDASAARPMADSRFGDIFDVLTVGAAADVMLRYRVLVVAGHLDAEAAVGGSALVDGLMQYVLEGGVVVVAVGNVRNSSASVLLTGFVPNGNFPTARAWSTAPQASSSSSSSSSSSFTREALSFAAGSLAPEDPSLNTSTSALVRYPTSIIHQQTVTSCQDTHSRLRLPPSRHKTHLWQIWQRHHVHSPLVRGQRCWSPSSGWPLRMGS
jgi:hypothetical protein